AMEESGKRHVALFMECGNGEDREATKKIVKKLKVSHKRSRSIVPRLAVREIFNFFALICARTSSPMRRGRTLFAKKPIIITQKRSDAGVRRTGSIKMDHLLERSKKSTM